MFSCLLLTGCVANYNLYHASCSAVAEAAVAISAEFILKVYNPALVSRSGEELICSGDALLNSGDRQETLFSLTEDSDSEQWVSYTIVNEPELRGFGRAPDPSEVGIAWSDQNPEASKRIHKIGILGYRIAAVVFVAVLVGVIALVVVEKIRGRTYIN